uniref:AMP-binding enzyme C-terminal domain-containing protein n=1 Tax=Parascaris equorum TaxID=6256 RepID=A0A914R653_PAREQ
RNISLSYSSKFFIIQGEYITPEKIENVYIHSKFVAQLFVHGESLKSCLVAIVVPDEEVLLKSSADILNIHDVSFEELCSNKEVKKMILVDMLDIGKKAGLCSFEQVKDIYVSSEQFTVENDLLTPTLKGKRRNLKKHFAIQIAEMYSKLK